jgi:hypothetical protein
MISMALLRPGDLPEDACESLYWNLEGLYLQTSEERISGAELKAVASRNGKQFAANYKMTTERSFTLMAIGYGLLMTRLSYRLGRLRAKVNVLHHPPSPYTRMASMMRDCTSFIHGAAVRHNEIALMTTPEIAWSDETMTFVEQSASVIAIKYPG